MSRASNPTFGAVSTINTAPVAIGNSMRGFQTQVLHTSDGVRVIGRDYAFAPTATGSITEWALTGGMPLTPCCMPSTALRNFVQMYNKFKFNKCIFHYITSSSTSTTGDVLFYYQKNASSSEIDWTNASFLPYVLSDANTVIGPQWTNHSIVVTPTGPYRSTDYGVSCNQELYSQGDIFLFSKTSSTESPGYVIFDYDITFKELSVNPRAGLLPLAKAQWQPVSFVFANGAVTSATQAVNTSLSTTFIGGVTISSPSFSVGDVYKFVIDSTNSNYVVSSNSTLLGRLLTNNTISSITLDDGYTIFAVAVSTTTCNFFSNDAAAFGQAINGAGLRFNGSYTLATDALRGYIKNIGSVAVSTLQNQY